MLVARKDRTAIVLAPLAGSGRLTIRAENSRKASHLAGRDHQRHRIRACRPATPTNWSGKATGRRGGSPRRRQARRGSGKAAMAPGSGSPEGTPFVDEAGQVSLANTIAMGVCARNIILVGDQMQLSEPTQGSHPGRSGLFALEHLLGGVATVPPERGVFLSKTRRMHPDLCRFISNAFYDGRLLPETGNERQGLTEPDADPALEATGIRFVASSTRDASRNPNRRLPMSAIAASFSGSPMADRWFRATSAPCGSSPSTFRASRSL